MKPTKTGLATSSGLPLILNASYAFLLVVAAPFLSGYLADDSDGGLKLTSAKTPVPGCACEGTIFAKFYVFTTVLLNGSNRYSDLMAWATACACGWDHAWMILVVVFLGWAVQTLVLVYQGSNLHFLEQGLLNVSVEGMSNSGTLQIASMVLMMHGAGNPAQKIRGGDLIAKLLTDSLPLAVLQIWFTIEVSWKVTVFFSLAFSLALATKSAVEGYALLAKEKEEKKMYMDLQLMIPRF